MKISVGLSKTLFIVFAVYLSTCTLSKKENVENRSLMSHRELLQKLTNYDDNVWYKEEYGKTYSDFLIKYGKPQTVYTETFLDYQDLIEKGYNVFCDLIRDYDTKEFKNVENFTLRNCYWYLGGPLHENMRVLFFFFDKEFYAVSIFIYDDNNRLYE